MTINELSGGDEMKRRASTVDIRIKDFMKKKMVEFPDLKDKYGPSVRVVERGYFLEDFMGLFTRRGLN